MLGNPFAQPLSMSSLVYLLVGKMSENLYPGLVALCDVWQIIERKGKEE